MARALVVSAPRSISHPLGVLSVARATAGMPACSAAEQAAIASTISSVPPVAGSVSSSRSGACLRISRWIRSVSSSVGYLLSSPSA